MPGIDTYNLHFPLVRYISLGRNSSEFDELNEHYLAYAHNKSPLSITDFQSTLLLSYNVNMYLKGCLVV